MQRAIVHGTGASDLPSIGLAQVWALLLQLATRAARADPLRERTCYALAADGALREVAASEASFSLDPNGAGVTGGLTGDARALLELMLPLVAGAHASSLVVGHLGQSLDGRVATPTGVSQFITGREDIVHTHRLRALFDAVIVGVRTVQLDDPQLTTRHVPGAHPTRVVLDPHGKLEGRYKLLVDGASPTLICTSLAYTPAPVRRGAVEWLGLPCHAGRFDLLGLRQALAERKLRRLFVEGGGVTVSRFLAARALDRLHVSVAPIILGSGASAFLLPPIDKLDEALALRCRHFSLGADLLFDCELASALASPAAQAR